MRGCPDAGGRGSTSAVREEEDGDALTAERGEYRLCQVHELVDLTGTEEPEETVAHLGRPARGRHPTQAADSDH